jgi:hypothetical protein
VGAVCAAAELGRNANLDVGHEQGVDFNALDLWEITGIRRKAYTMHVQADN